MDPRTRIEALRQQIRCARRALLRPQRSRDHRRRVRRVDARAAGARRGASRPRHAGFADPARWRTADAGVSDGRALFADAQPGQCLRRGRPASVRRTAAQGRGARRGRGAVCSGVEDRWLEHCADLREPPPGSRRHARGRHARRGRDRERPHHQVDSADAPRRTAVQVRSARRGVPAARVVRSNQPGEG